MKKIVVVVEGKLQVLVTLTLKVLKSNCYAQKIDYGKLSQCFAMVKLTFICNKSAFLNMDLAFETFVC